MGLSSFDRQGDFAETAANFGARGKGGGGFSSYPSQTGAGPGSFLVGERAVNFAVDYLDATIRLASKILICMGSFLYVFPGSFSLFMYFEEIEGQNREFIIARVVLRHYAALLLSEGMILSAVVGSNFRIRRMAVLGR